MMKEEGAGVFYRGIVAPIFAEAPKRAVKFACNEKYKQLFRRSDGSMTIPRFFAAGSAAGITEAFVNVPFEVIKVRLQSPAGKELYKSTMDCAFKVIKSEGPLALYNGLEAQLWRNAAWNGTYFGLIGTLKQKLWTPKSKKSETGRNFMAGVIASTLGTLLNTPFDVVKSRLQNVKVGSGPQYNYALPALVNICRTEGFASLYRGLSMRLLRLGPGGGIMLVAFDNVQALFRKMNYNRAMKAYEAQQ
eukprot:TRINITY_DN34034_c0_g1_i2.p1 TRINITY_DN34034_c0_g1~~TRINITY_DN34034_c0_g1_i2.p1  ORF type:complete len:247 (-),score=91.12 TRINITY_DN34034_c0_g1_i2:105-845(-)